MNPGPTPRGENDGFPILYGWNGVDVLNLPDLSARAQAGVSLWYGVYVDFSFTGEMAERSKAHAC